MNIDPLSKRIGKKLRQMTRDERIQFIQIINKQAFKVGPSCMIQSKKENGLYANIPFEKGELVGIYHGELLPYSELKRCFDDKNYLDTFLEKYKLETRIDRLETLKSMLKLSFQLDENSVLVMPKYPTNGNENFYMSYNPMLFVNEPAQEKIVENPFSEKSQDSEVNVLALTNFEHKTVDYIACKRINIGDEILVYYGQIYNRDDYDIPKNK